MENTRKITILISLTLFLSLLIGGCTSEPKEVAKIEHKTIDVDLSYSERWPVQKWKIRDRQLKTKWWIEL